MPYFPIGLRTGCLAKRDPLAGQWYLEGEIKKREESQMKIGHPGVRSGSHRVIAAAPRRGSSRSAGLVHKHCLLDLCATGEASIPLAVTPPIEKCSDGSEEPQQRAREVDPYRVLHSLDVGIALGVFVDEHLLCYVSTALVRTGLDCRSERKLGLLYISKNAEQSDPEDEQHQVPYPDSRES